MTCPGPRDAGPALRRRRVALLRRKPRKAASEVLDFVGLAGMEEVLAKDLTLPRQKRLEVARALATKPAILTAG